jgi:hypothetical protein
MTSTPLQVHNSALNAQLRDELQRVQQLRSSLERQLAAGATQQGARSQHIGKLRQQADSSHSTATVQQQQEQAQVVHMPCEVS